MPEAKKPKRSRLLRAALPAVSSHLHKRGPAVYLRRDLHRLFRANRDNWHLPYSLTAGPFIKFLVEQAQLHEIALDSPYARLIRFIYGDVSPFAVALSIDSSAYLSHGSAALLHGLIDDTQMVVYLNKEQSEKPQADGEITQDGIDRAFQRPQRRSKNVFQYGEYGITMISGKNTDRLGVEDLKGPNGEWLKAASLERTLIDIAVRPGYSGGVDNVLVAYKRAASKTSLEVLYRILRHLDYKYPYHQAIGFYLSKAGFSDSQLSPLLTLGTRFKFYLDYDLSKSKLDEKWNVFY